MTEQLLALLRRRRNHHGLSLAHQSVLLDELRSSTKDLNAALRELTERGEIEIISPLPFLAVRFPLWPGSSGPLVLETQQPLHREPIPLRGPVSSIAAAATNSSSGDRGAAEGEALLREVLAVLGPEADADEFRGILEGRSSEMIRRALRRVEATVRIRVSRAALFRSLLNRLS